MSIIISIIWKFISNPNVYKPVLIIMAILAFILLLKDRNEQKSRADRQSNNVEALMEDSVMFVNKYNQVVIQKDAIVLTYSEFKNSKSKEIDFIKKELNANHIKIKQLQAIIDGTIGTTDSGYVYLHDTAYIDTVSKKLEKLKVGDWENTWTKIDFTLNSKYKLSFKVQTYDTLILALYKYKEKTFSTDILPDSWVFWQGWKYAGSANLTRPGSFVSMQPIILQKK